MPRNRSIPPDRDEKPAPRNRSINPDADAKPPLPRNRSLTDEKPAAPRNRSISPDAPAPRKSGAPELPPGLRTVAPAPVLGPLAERFAGAISNSDPLVASRGRALARTGRVSDVVITPGLVTAAVTDGSRRDVSIRVAPLGAKAWGKLVERLASRLDLVAGLIEGDLPALAVAKLDAGGLRLVATRDDLEFDCDCGDWHRPCPHAIAVFAHVGQALDTDPLLAFLLRGRTRGDLIAELAAVWVPPQPPPQGGVRLVRRPTSRVAEEEWVHSVEPLPRLTFNFEAPEAVVEGLRAAGAAPDGMELQRALAPLYAAGGEAARVRALAEFDAVELLAPTGRPPPSDGPPTTEGLRGRIIEVLGRAGSARSQDLAEAVGGQLAEVRRALIDLESQELVYRTGNTRGTRWWLV